MILPFESNFSKGRVPGIDKQNELVSRDKLRVSDQEILTDIKS